MDKTKEIEQKEYMYFARDSFNIADDVCAPNPKRYEIANWDRWDYKDMCMCLQDYFIYLPPHHWRGYCYEKRFVDVYYKKIGERHIIFEVELVENWKELLAKEKCIFFRFASQFNNYILPETEERILYTAEKVEALIRSRIKC